ncbi:MAG: endonuclease/exonuclease/phosphatase family protein [Pseudomonadota bacterium]
MRFSRPFLITLVAVIGFNVNAGVPDPAEPITVLTRNVYVGADIFRVTQADPIFIVPTIAAVYQTVVDNDFEARAQLLADEIAAGQPHLVGLQEVALVRRQSPGDVFLGNPVPATDIDMDYLQMLLDALADRGAGYSVAVAVDNADIELPLLTDSSLDDIRLTDRDVILVRDDVTVEGVSAGNFSTNVIVELSGAVIDFNRGYTSADVAIDGRGYRFVNTHLEVGSQAVIQGEQAVELAGLLSDETRPLILVGDINAGPSSPAFQAYGQLIEAGFTDLWDARAVDDDDPGLTCCFSETIDEPAPNFSSRIDVIFARNMPSTAVSDVEASVVGTSTQTASGRWPSDHAGVLATFRLLGLGDDGDADDVVDALDNCIGTFNPDQRDSDGDQFGNVCDADFNQDGVVNVLDLGVFRLRFGSADPDTDLNGDGVVNTLDLGLFRSLFFGEPGPSGLSET